MFDWSLTIVTRQVVRYINSIFTICAGLCLYQLLYEAILEINRATVTKSHRFVNSYVKLHLGITRKLRLSSHIKVFTPRLENLFAKCSYTDKF